MDSTTNEATSIQYRRVTTLGIIGGIGPKSTVEYYRAIFQIHGERHGRAAAPSIVVNSVDVQKLLAMIGATDLAAVADYLVAEIGGWSAPARQRV